jgi:hypothetical protein
METIGFYWPWTDAPTNSLYSFWTPWEEIGHLLFIRMCQDSFVSPRAGQSDGYLVILSTTALSAECGLVGLLGCYSSDLEETKHGTYTSYMLCYRGQCQTESDMATIPILHR